MFRSMQQREATGARSTIDMAPLIDIVFILLIFFLVTTTFRQDDGIEVQRPEAVAVSPLEPRSLRVQVTSGGALFLEGERIEAAALRERIRRARADDPRLAVVVIPDAQAPAGRLVEVMDAARLAGVEDIAVAAAAKEGAR